ncbi:MAG: autoinducer binding domain-containing protein [Alphaproteobacteria bacterium]|nr:autoinducer binding domain-containing protein [Alphaproteobacteria bacterium]
MAATVAQIEQLIRQESLDGLARSLAGLVRDLGFQCFAYHVIRPPFGRPSPSNIYSYSEDWMDHYEVEGYGLIDPTFSQAAKTVLPYTWQRLKQHRDLDRRGRRVFEEAREFGLIQGVSIPVHGPEGALALLSFATGTSEDEFSEILNTSFEILPSIASYTHEACMQVAPGSDDYQDICLTPRERECLTWTANGKTSWEIGEILGISRKTADFHLDGAARKLGVFSKHHAVVKALLLGLIEP